MTLTFIHSPLHQPLQTSKQKPTNYEAKFPQMVQQRSVSQVLLSCNGKCHNVTKDTLLPG